MNLKLLIALVFSITLMACGNNSKNVTGTRVGNGGSAQRLNAVQEKEILGTWLIESLFDKEQKVYDLDKGVIAGTPSEVFGITASENSKIMMTFEIDETVVATKVYKNGVLETSEEGNYTFNKGKITIIYGNKKSRVIKAFRRGGGLSFMEGTKRYDIKKQTTQQIKKLLDSQTTPTKP